MNSNDNVLGVCFRVGAKLKCDRQSLVKSSEGLKNLKRIDGKPILRYAVIKAREDDSMDILELSDDYICLFFTCRKQGSASYNSNLVLFLSFMPWLDEFYDIKFGDLYSYVIEAINHGWSNTVKSDPEMIKSLKKRIFALNDSNCKLSQQLVMLSNVKDSVIAELAIYRKFSKRVVEAARENGESGKNGAMSYLLAETGMDAEELRTVKIYLNQ